eukprot:2871537-Amphidinium_carterae.1
MVGVWTSPDKKKQKTLDPCGSVGRFLMCDTCVTHILVPDADGDDAIVKGLKPLKALPEIVQHSQPVEIPPGWSDLAVQALAALWTVIRIPTGNPLWVRLAD